MKTTSLLALLCIGGVIYYVTGGGALFGLVGPTHLPDSVETPNATFMGNEKVNPYFAGS